jgi:hypothetical protein
MMYAYLAQSILLTYMVWDQRFKDEFVRFEDMFDQYNITVPAINHDTPSTSLTVFDGSNFGRAGATSVPM